MSEGPDAAVPFLGIDEGRLRLRPFGLYREDLDIDFRRQRRPYLVTEVLRRCITDTSGATPEESFFWGLTVGKRIECLSAIAYLDGYRDFESVLRCADDSCKEPMEIDISLESLMALQDKANESECVTVDVNGSAVSLRKPTGADQLTWLHAAYVDEDEAIGAAISTLATGSEMQGTGSNAWLVEPIQAAMQELDPLVSYCLRVKCPACGAELDYEVDLEDMALRRLRDAQARLIEEVHCIASKYHWSEEQILSIPAWRRSRYITMIERDDAR